MLNKSLLNLRGALLGGLVVLTILASTLPILPYGTGLGDGAFTLLMLLILTYLFDTAFHGIKVGRKQNEK